MLLAISAFGLSLLGTFLVRSGVLTSVHAFATDPTRGVFILALLVFFIGGSLLLYAWRAPKTINIGHFQLFSRETFLLANSAFMLVAMLTVLLGTLYPLFAEALGAGKLSVGPPYFNTVFIPIVLPIFLLLGIGIHIRWKKDDIGRVKRWLISLFVTVTLLALVITLLSVGQERWLTFAGLAAAFWIVGNTLLAIVMRFRNSNRLRQSLRNAPAGFYGMHFAHVGLAISIVGVTFTSLHSVDAHERLAPGDSVNFAEHEFLLRSLEKAPGPNYESTQATVEVSKDDELITTLLSEKRFYQVRGMPMTEAGIDPGWTRDIYISLGEPIEGNDWSMRIYHKPFVRWIWLGAIFMAIGGLFAATDRRYRATSRQSAKDLGDLRALTGARSGN